MKKFLFIIMCVFFFSCSKTKKNTKVENVHQSLVESAKGFDIQKFENYYLLTIKAPYQNSTNNYKYVLTKVEINASPVPNVENIIQIPVRKIIATSTTDIPMIEIFHEESTLVGFPNCNYISSKRTRVLIDKGLVQEIGMDANLNTEVTFNLEPDVIVGFSVSSKNKSLEILKELGVNVIYNGAWLEETPLGRAEWLKLFGLLYDKSDEADSIFNAIKANYNRLKNTALKTEMNATILSGAMFNDVWNMPAGDSFVSQFLNDANTDYIWKDTKGIGSLQLSFETVLDKGKNADLWIGSGAFSTKKEFLDSNSHYKEFDAFINDNVYTFSNKKGATGGLLYYELGALRPDLILTDIIKIAHPSLLNEKAFTFFEKME